MGEGLDQLIGNLANVRERAERAGDEIEGIKTHSSAGWHGWSTVLNRTTGEQGIVPTSYVC